MKKIFIIIFAICSLVSTSFANDWLTQQKQLAVERANYWSKQGYHFDPDYMNALMMDQKVKDIDRANYWSKQGYHFDPDYMNALMMDQSVENNKNTRSIPKQQTTTSSFSSYRPSGYRPPIAENGDIRGVDNDGDGRLVLAAA